MGVSSLRFRSETTSNLPARRGNRASLRELAQQVGTTPLRVEVNLEAYSVFMAKKIQHFIDIKARGGITWPSSLLDLRNDTLTLLHQNPHLQAPLLNTLRDLWQDKLLARAIEDPLNIDWYDDFDKMIAHALRELSATNFPAYEDSMSIQIRFPQFIHSSQAKIAALPFRAAAQARLLPVTR